MHHCVPSSNTNTPAALPSLSTSTKLWLFSLSPPPRPPATALRQPPKNLLQRTQPNRQQTRRRAQKNPRRLQAGILRRRWTPCRTLLKRRCSPKWLLSARCFCLLPQCPCVVLLSRCSALPLCASGFLCDARAQELSGRWDAKMQHLQQRLQSLEAK
jgi:hypothetical protein